MKEEQGMRTDAGAGEERKGPFLICAAVGGATIQTEVTQNPGSDRAG